MPTNKVDALVIFGATGDLAKLETFPALVGLVKRGVLDVPVIGVAKSGWGLEQFRDYATASLKLNKMDPSTPAATKMLSLLRYVDGDLDDAHTYQAMSAAIGPNVSPDPVVRIMSVLALILSTRLLRAAAPWACACASLPSIALPRLPANVNPIPLCATVRSIVRRVVAIIPSRYAT